jgi:hypothetical protein
MGNGGEAERGRLWGILSVSHVDLLEMPCVINDVQPAKHELGHADTASQKESRSLDLNVRSTRFSSAVRLHGNGMGATVCGEGVWPFW